ncbi:MAG: ABC transporter permease [Lachnospiraceae bacterium]|nr:ABC transporter permease [Lachnospiraceae bacterium]
MKRILDFLKRVPRYIYVLLIIAAALLVLALIPYVIRVTLEDSLIDQQAAETWSDEGKGVSQISVFYPNGQTNDDFGIRSLQYDISQEMIKASLLEQGEDEKDLFVTCSSSQGIVSIARDDGKQQIKANAIGTNGDFFRFHPVRLLSGEIYSPSLLVPDHILIDETLAWQLFGSYEIVGRTVSISGIPHTIDGVFTIPQRGFIEKKAQIPENLCIISLSSLCQLGTIVGEEPGDNGTDAAAIGTAKIYGIRTFEIVMPNPVRNFALNILREKIKPDDSGIVLVENSTRFSEESLLGNLGNLFTAGIQTNPVVFPYWENIARGYTNLFSLLYLLQLLLTVPAWCLILLCALKLWKMRTWTLSSLWQMLMDKKYDLESRMHSTHDKWEHF